MSHLSSPPMRFDVIGGDKVGGDKVSGDKVGRDVLIFAPHIDTITIHVTAIVSPQPHSVPTMLETLKTKVLLPIIIVGIIGTAVLHVYK